MATTQVQCNGTRGAYYAIALTYTENSTSVANNTSNITLTGVIKSTNSYYSYYGYTNTGKLSVDGSAVKTSTSTAEVNTSGVTLVTYTGDVAHSADGSKTVTVKFDFSTTYGYLSDTSITVNWELSTIPRASTITASDKTISGTTTANALSYTITSATSFYHTLTYKIGNTTTTIFGTSNPQQVSSTYTGTIPATTILDLIPASKTATVTFTLKTFSDSACKNQIGATQTGTCTVTITIVPTVTLSSITINSTPISGYYVAGKTVAKLTYSKTTPRGASSVTVYFSANKGVTFASSSATSGTTVLTNTLPASTSNYTFTVSVYAIDSRGNQSTTKTLTSSTVYAYAQPKITGKFIRVADATSTTEDSAGGYVYGTYSGTVGASVNGQNTITSTSCLMNGTGSSLASGFHEVLAQSSGATFVVTVTDKVGTSVSQTFTVSTAVFPLDLYDDGQGTVGVGMGTTAVGGEVKSSMPLHINGGTGNDLYYNSLGIYEGSIATANGIMQLANTRQDLLFEAPSRGIMLGYQRTTQISAYAPFTTNVELKRNRWLTTTDKSDAEYELIGDNGSNMWIGTSAATSSHHVGGTYISAGYDADNSKGYASVKISVPNTDNTGATNYNVYHAGYCPPLSNEVFTSGIAVYSNRCTLTHGGYERGLGMCYVNLYITMNTSLSANNNWTLFTGFPVPLYETALTCAPGPSNTGSYSARIDANGSVMVCTGSTALSSGKIIIISGWYQTKSIYIRN